MDYWYKDSEGLFHVKSDIYTTNEHILKIYANETVIALEEIDTNKIVFGPIEVTNILKEDNSYYTDLNDLLSAVDGFFKIITVPFQSDLLTLYKTITDNNFAESIKSLPAKFLPKIAEFDGIEDDVITWNPALLDLNIVWSVAFRGDRFTKTFTAFIVGGRNTRNLMIVRLGHVGYRGGDSVYHIWDGSGNTDIILSPASVQFSLVFFADGTNIHAVYDGVYKGYVTPSACEIYLDKFGTTDTNHYVDGIYSDFRVWDTNIGQAEAELFHNDEMTSDPNIYNGRLTGNEYEYDLSPAANHGVRSGPGNRFTHDLNGSLYANKIGYSLWQLAANPDIQVPFDIDGNAISLTPGVDIPTGYEHERDLPPGGVNWNMADSRVNFENSGEAVLDILDRSNATYQNATSRDSSHYNAARPFEYHISELDPRVLNTYMEPTAIDRLFGKFVLDGTVIILWKEFLNYATQKVGADLVTVQEFCGITEIYP